MKSIRRSLNKGEKDRISSPTNFVANPSPPLPISSKAPEARNIIPKKVIRATCSYQARTPTELSFESGDFFHVLSDRPQLGPEGDEWFDASNPATNARGFVPAVLFQVLGRNERETATVVTNSAQAHIGPPPPQQQQQPLPPPQHQQLPATTSLSATSTSTSSPPLHNPPHPQQHLQHSPIPISSFTKSPNSNPSSSSSVKASPPMASQGSKAQSLYGVVLYDFQAERADELDAKKGEPIIIIAQSNHEWFVAKPIGRLGGPGLIPITFVEIQNMSTGKPLDPTVVAEMIRGGALPPVEEWKKSTAEYKQASIPLGRFDFPQQQQQQQQQQQLPPPSNNSSSTDINNKHISDHQPSSSMNGSFSSSHNLNHSNNSINHVKQGSVSSYQDPNADPHSHGFYSPNPNPNHHHDPNQEEHLHDPSHSDGQEQSRQPEPQIHHQQQQQQQSFDDPLYRYKLVIQASVESFHYEEDSYWFHIRASFVSGASLVLYRLYEDFYDFQIDLMDSFPVEAGRRPAHEGEALHRIIPKMPGPLDEVNDRVCAQRVNDLSEYLHNLCALPEYIREHQLLYDFFAPRAGDVEITGPSTDDELNQHHQQQQQQDKLQPLNPNGHGKTYEDTGVEYLNNKNNSDVPDVGTLSLNGSEDDPYGGRRRTGESTISAAYARNDRSSEGGSSIYSNRIPGLGHAKTGSTTSGFVASHDRGLGSSSSIQNMKMPSSSPNNIPPTQSSTPTSATTNKSQQQQQQAQQQQQQPPFIKIKIFHRNTDDLIALRVPPNVLLNTLLDKARGRLGDDVTRLRYREDANGSTSGPASSLPANNSRLIEIDSDEDLEDWIRSGSRLVLYAD